MPLRRLAALAPVVVVAIGAAVVLPHSPAALRHVVLAAGVVAPVVMLAAWVVLTPALFPGPVLAAAGGLAFGAAGGTALAWGGAVLGGLAAFSVARTVARGAVEPHVRRSARLARLNALLERRGFAAILAARLMPGVPASGLHYAAGISPVRRSAFAAAIAIGALLRTTPYALLGDGLATGSAAPLIAAASSVAIGAAGATLLLRRARARVEHAHRDGLLDAAGRRSRKTRDDRSPARGRRLVASTTTRPWRSS
jgi:uncharacterized membrane protein YdjX (TVP38/TMEM64 family)